jgi:hypothetical protein
MEFIHHQQQQNKGFFIPSSAENFKETDVGFA